MAVSGKIKIRQTRYPLPAWIARTRLAAIYVKRGIDLELALRVARELMEKDALNANARDALGFPKSAWRDRYRPY
jgi:hypothetical protein